jgi:hypothetical protein
MITSWFVFRGFSSLLITSCFVVGLWIVSVFSCLLRLLG